MLFIYFLNGFSFHLLHEYACLILLQGSELITFSISYYYRRVDLFESYKKLMIGHNINVI